MSAQEWDTAKGAINGGNPDLIVGSTNQVKDESTTAKSDSSEAKEPQQYAAMLKSPVKAPEPRKPYTSKGKPTFGLGGAIYSESDLPPEPTQPGRSKKYS